MNLGTRFYNGFVSKISKIRIVWPWEFFLFGLRARHFSWNNSVTEVNEYRKLYFLLLFITKYFKLLILIKWWYFHRLCTYLDEQVCKLYILKLLTIKNLANVCTWCDIEISFKNFAIKLVAPLWNLECKYRNIRK